MKVLHCYKVYRPDVDGGIPFVIAALCKLSDDGIENKVLVARQFGIGKRYRQHGVPVEAVTSFGTLFSTPLAPSYPLALLRSAADCDVIVHHAPFPLTDLVALRLPDAVSLIIYWHADILGRPLLKSLVAPSIDRALRRADAIVVSDVSVIDSSPALHPFRDKCVVVPYGIKLATWTDCSASEQAQAEQLRHRYPRLILGIGRLVPYKGFDVLLRSMAGLDAQLVLIGDGPLRHELMQCAEELGIADRVTFAGRIPTSTIKSFLHAAQALAFPSVTSAEAFGIVQLEAMAVGLPVVNTALPTAVPLVARHDQEALTVPIGDAGALAAALRRILDEPLLAERLGNAGRRRANEEYSQERFLSRIKAVYDSARRARRAKQ